MPGKSINLYCRWVQFVARTMIFAFILMLSAAGTAWSQCDPCARQGADPWEDSRWMTVSGRKAALAEAINGLRRAGLMTYAEKFGFDIYYDGGDTECRDDDAAAGCNLRKVSKRVVQDHVVIRYNTGETESRPTGHKLTEKDLECTVYITPCVFNKGWVNLDEDGEVFWDDDPDVDRYDFNNLYYCYANDLIEALQFVILHELKHIESGAEYECNLYAKETILALREQGRYANLESLAVGFSAWYSYPHLIPDLEDDIHCLHLTGPPPRR